MTAGSPSRRGILLGAASTALAGLVWRPLAADPARLPELPVLAELPLDRSSPGVARGLLRAAPMLGGLAANQLAYNGQYPGPLLRLREGERLELTFYNQTDRPSNLHYHGLHVDPSGQGDNPWLAAEPGGRITYSFEVGAGNTGLHWYHPHVHGRAGSSAMAQMRGLVGPLLVESANGDPLPTTDDRIVVLHDMSLEQGRIPSPGLNEFAVGREGELLLLNGVHYPKITARCPWLRLRLINASNARYWQLHPSDGAPLILVARDGMFLAAPEAVGEILLPPGARAELMVRMRGRAPFDLLYRPYSRVGSVWSEEQPVLHIRAKGRFEHLKPLPEQLVTWPTFNSDRAVRRRDIPIALLTICGRYFDDRRTDLEVAAGSREVWTLRNVDLMDHPIHLHTWRFEPLSLNGQPMPYRARLDTVNLRPGDEMEVGIDFAQFRGRSLLHCHIVEHADKGMMAVINVA
jgi:FtsP/CotA-like multicopper oxidase with cupredoxin domain